MLASAAAVAILLLAVAGAAAGEPTDGALLAIGLFNSIMFPTIFTLASEGAHEGSGIICIAIVGGAIMPLITGNAAHVAGLRVALAVPAACYTGIMAFGIYARRPDDSQRSESSPQRRLA